MILDTLNFQFGLAISSNQIIDALENRALDKNQLEQIDQDIRIRTAELVERLQARILDMEYFQTDISTAKEYQEVSNRQFQLVSGAMRPDTLEGLREAVNVISRRRRILRSDADAGIPRRIEKSAFARKPPGILEIAGN